MAAAVLRKMNLFFFSAKLLFSLRAEGEYKGVRLWPECFSIQSTHQLRLSLWTLGVGSRQTVRNEAEKLDNI